MRLLSRDGTIPGFRTWLAASDGLQTTGIMLASSPILNCRSIMARRRCAADRFHDAPEKPAS